MALIKGDIPGHADQYIMAEGDAAEWILQDRDRDRAAHDGRDEL